MGKREVNWKKEIGLDRAEDQLIIPSVILLLRLYYIQGL